ncbi:MAG: peptide ligase PGM1-related protein, partial [Myxococcota bacterium]
ANPSYRLNIQDAGFRIAELLRARGVLGRFAVDFISVKEGDIFTNYAIEINLRKGGTTLPYLMLQFMTNGTYDLETGLFRIPTGHPRYYYASDNLQSPHYRGLVPDDLMDILVSRQLYFHSARQEGVVFHLMGALSEFGKLGLVCIGDSPETAYGYYQQTVAILDQETHFSPHTHATPLPKYTTAPPLIEL